MVEKVKEQFKTLFWFLSRPKYIPQILQVLKRGKNRALENSRSESTKWCEEVAIDIEEAYWKLISNRKVEELASLFPTELRLAKDREAACEVKMGGEGAISFIYHLVKSTKSLKIIETGVAYGWSSLAILLAIKNREGACLISNDMPYIKLGNDDHVGCVVPEELRTNWELQREPDIVGIPKAIKKIKDSVDLFHYDSDKSYTGRMWSSPLIWDALRKGGFFVADDINDNLAFKHFAEKVNRKPVIIEHQGKFVGVIKK